MCSEKDEFWNRYWVLKLFEGYFFDKECILTLFRNGVILLREINKHLDNVIEIVKDDT